MVVDVDFHAEGFKLAREVIDGEIQLLLLLVQAGLPHLSVTELVLHGDGGNAHAALGIAQHERRDVARPQRVVLALEFAALPFFVGFEVRRRRPGRSEQRDSGVFGERGFDDRQRVLLVARDGKAPQVCCAVGNIRVSRQRKIAAAYTHSAVIISDAVFPEIAV